MARTLVIFLKKLASFTALVPVKVPKLVQTFLFQQKNTVGIFRKQAVVLKIIKLFIRYHT